MGDERGAVTIDLLLWVAGTLIAVMVFIGIVWPWLLGIWYTSCWTGARTELRSFGHEIEGGVRGVDQSIEYRLSLGDCIAGVVFLNGEEARNEYAAFFNNNCGEYDGYKSYMIVIPQEFITALNDQEAFDEKVKEKLKELKDSLKFWDAVKLWFKEKTGRAMPTYCYEFKKHISPSSTTKSVPESFFESPFSDENWNKGANDYCLKVTGIQAGESDYNYRIETFTCPAKKEENE